MVINLRRLKILAVVLAVAPITGAKAAECDIDKKNGWKWTNQARDEEQEQCFRGRPPVCFVQSSCLSAENEWLALTKGPFDGPCNTGHVSYCGIGSSPWLDHKWLGNAPHCPKAKNAPKLCDAENGYVAIALDTYGDKSDACSTGKRVLCVKRKLP